MYALQQTFLPPQRVWAWGRQQEVSDNPIMFSCSVLIHVAVQELVVINLNSQTEAHSGLCPAQVHVAREPGSQVRWLWPRFLVIFFSFLE